MTRQFVYGIPTLVRISGRCGAYGCGPECSIFSQWSVPASGSKDKTVRLWDPNTGKRIKTLEGHPFWWAHSVAFSPDGRTLASGGGAEIRLWEPNTGTHIGTLEGHSSGGVKSVIFSPDGSVLASGGGPRSSDVVAIRTDIPKSK